MRNSSTDTCESIVVIIDHEGRIDTVSINNKQTSHLSLFQENMLFEEVQWKKVFTAAPSDSTQLLSTYEGRTFLFTLHLVQANSYINQIVTLANISQSMFNPYSNEEQHKTDELIMESSAMKRISKIIKTIAHVGSTVLLLGESGVGKSQIAKFIHSTSTRSTQPFISVNCGAIPESLIESELFGYEEGTFTGGKKGGKVGLFEAAHKGTIFLDEIAEFPLNLQAKLLGVLQENAVRKVGSTEEKKVDVRVIAATNKNLQELVEKKLFREDLFYRLNVVPLTIPPLREREKDIHILIDHFLFKYNTKYHLRKEINDEVKQELIQYKWPGNIRELENTIERIVVTNMTEKEVLEEKNIRENGWSFSPKAPISLKEAKRQVEKELILKAYGEYKSTYKVAEVLQVDQSTISKKLKVYKKEGF
jgi:transcriptional regulator with PAS, ATPase and Fis domain